MGDFGEATGGAVSGATTGMVFGGPVGAAIGGGLGFLGGLFGGDSEEETRQKRKKELIANLLKARTEAIKRQHLLQAGQAGYSRQAAAERAAAGGRTGGDAEAMILPAEGRAIQTIGDDTIKLEQSYDNMLYNVESDFADRPIPPSPWDYIKEGGKAFAQEKLNENYINALKNAPMGGGTAGGNAAAPSGLSNSTVSSGGNLMLDESAVQDYEKNPWAPMKKKAQGDEFLPQAE
jgi:hypothetical protein